MSQVEEHVVIGSDRVLVVPESLQKIAVQYDHNVNTITFDCPRMWDGRDISEMDLYVNYLRPDGMPNAYKVEESSIVIDETDDSIFHFDWVVDKFATLANGHMTVLVCARKMEDGNQKNHWNSELNHDFYVSEGLEVNKAIEQLYPDEITRILLNLGTVEEDIKSIKAVLYGQGGGSSGEGDSEAGALTDRVEALEASDNELSGRVENLEKKSSAIYIKTVNGVDLRIFAGTKADYDKLDEETKKDLFAIITDDDSAEKLANVVSAVEKILNGEQQVTKATFAGRATYDSVNTQKTIAEQFADIKSGATEVGKATKAVKDVDGNQINTTYVKVSEIQEHVTRASYETIGVNGDKTASDAIAKKGLYVISIRKGNTTRENYTLFVSIHSLISANYYYSYVSTNSGESQYIGVQYTPQEGCFEVLRDPDASDTFYIEDVKLILEYAD